MARSVFLSAGHSDSDPGAVAHGYREADIAVEFRNMVSFYLTRARVNHDLDGKGTDNLPLREAIKRASLHSIAVEFHCNAATAISATGVETLSHPQDMFLGSQIAKAIADALRIKNRGSKPENAGQHHRLAFIRDANGIIVELFFLTNINDLAAYQARKWLAAKAVAEVLIEEATR